MTTTSTPEQIRAKRETRREWYGYLADENVQHIADRIHTMLDGKCYTFVSNNVEHKSAAPEVRTGQRLTPEKHARKESPRVTRIGDEQAWGDGTSMFCSITCADTYGVWGIHSSHATESEAREDPRFRTYIHIVGGLGHGGREQIEIHQKNGYDETLHWVIAPEPCAEDAS